MAVVLIVCEMSAKIEACIIKSQYYLLAVTRENSRAFDAIANIVCALIQQIIDTCHNHSIYMYMCMCHCSLSLHHFDVDIKLKAQAIIITLPSGFQSMPVSRDRKAYSLKVSGLISDVKINGTYFLT